MNKELRLGLIIFGVVVTIIIVAAIGVALMVGLFTFSTLGNISEANEYTMGEDIIPSMKFVVGERKINSVSSEIKNGITVKTMEFTSDSVQEDLLKYVEYLRENEQFYLTRDMDLAIIPGTIQLGKASIEEKNLIIMNIEYSAFGYVIELQKGEGTLNLY